MTTRNLVRTAGALFLFFEAGLLLAAESAGPLQNLKFRNLGPAAVTRAAYVRSAPPYDVR